MKTLTKWIVWEGITSIGRHPTHLERSALLRNHDRSPFSVKNHTKEVRNLIFYKSSVRLDACFSLMFLIFETKL